MIVEIIYKIFNVIITKGHKILNSKIYGKNVKLFGIPHLVHREKIRIGSNSRINYGVSLYGHGGIELGENVTLSHGVSIFSTGYTTKNWVSNKLEKVHSDEPVLISSNVWVGANSTILKGISVEEGCIIAAGSVVTKNLTEKNAIYAGNPAEFIKKLE